MTKMLSSLGFGVETLASGEEAIRRLQQDREGKGHKVELVLMDWKMEGLDGIETSRQIRNDLHLSLPIIMMTAFTREVHKSEAEKVGTNGFLTKPIFQSTLFDAIMDAFGKADSRQSGVKSDFTTRASMYKKHLKGCRILVAEDNVTNQRVAKAILEAAGIVVRMVGNGEEAVFAVQRESFDAVLMDVQMPKMNGYEATIQIRTLPRAQTLPIIAMTAHALKGDEEKCLESGMDGYVAKPISQDRLFYTLWRLLRNRPRVDGTTVAEAVPFPPAAHRYAVEEEDLAPAEKTRASLPMLLPGIDVETVLQTTGLDRQTYMEILLGFLRDNQDTAGNLRRAEAADDRATLLQLAHSLKGSAGNIGAGDLQRAANALESGCSEKKATEAVAPLVQSVLQELAMVLCLRERLVVETAGGDGGGPALAPTVAGDLHELLRALTEAIELADPELIRTRTTEILKRLGGRNIVEQSVLQALETQTRRYDYDQALKTVQYIKDSAEAHR
jgi:CheY-like chemotaxis protein